MRDLLVSCQLNGILACSAREGPQPCSVIGNLSVWNRCLNGSFTSGNTGAGRHSLNATAGSGDVAHDGTCVTVWNGDLQVSHRLQENGFCLINSLLETNASGRLECHLVGVNWVVRALVDSNFNVNHRITSQNAFTHGLLDTLINSGDEAAWDVAANDFVDKLVARIWVWLNAQPAVAVLTGTAGLLLMPTLSACNSTDRLAIWDAERNLMCGNAGSLLKTLEKNGYLCLTDCRNNGLTGVLVALNLEGWISVGGLLQEREELALGAALIRLNGRAVQGVGEPECGGLNLAGNGKRVARHGLELWNYHNVAGCSGAHISCFFAAHTIQVRKALGLACASVDKLNTCRNSTCKHLYKGKLAVLWILQRLESKRNGALVIR